MSAHPDAPVDSAYVAALWEHPDLCLAIFGIQILSAAGQRRYEASGIRAELEESLRTAAGLLATVPCQTPDAMLLLQYWRDSASLHAWARIAPHTGWWKWLVENRGKGVGFHHEIYNVAAGEAIYEAGARPIGPALFCQLEMVRSGEGRSRERLQRFADARQRS
jgi:heme-degrading monooxygenase HmoA